MKEPQIIIGIPGMWANRTELVQEIATKSGGYLLAGNIIHNADRNIGFGVDVQEHEPLLKQAFSYALVGKLENELLAKIDQHTFTVYIISKVINLDSIREIIDVGVGILKAGGIAIKIETVGVAYTKEEWGNLAENKDSFPLYSHFVTLVRDENLIYSCGMQSFGLSDVVVSSKIDPAVATDLINSFNLYILLENPEIKDGNTFSIDDESPMYMVSHVTDFR